MTTPKFILELREKIGHDLLWLTGITGVVLDDDAAGPPGTPGRQRPLVATRRHPRTRRATRARVDPGDPRRDRSRGRGRPPGQHRVPAAVLVPERRPGPVPRPLLPLPPPPRHPASQRRRVPRSRLLPPQRPTTRPGPARTHLHHQRPTTQRTPAVHPLTPPAEELSASDLAFPEQLATAKRTLSADAAKRMDSELTATVCWVRSCRVSAEPRPGLRTSRISTWLVILTPDVASGPRAPSVRTARAGADAADAGARRDGRWFWQCRSTGIAGLTPGRQLAGPSPAGAHRSGSRTSEQLESRREHGHPHRPCSPRWLDQSRVTAPSNVGPRRERRSKPRWTVSESVHMFLEVIFARRTARCGLYNKYLRWHCATHRRSPDGRSKRWSCCCRRLGAGDPEAMRYAVRAGRGTVAPSPGPRRPARPCRPSSTAGRRPSAPFCGASGRLRARCGLRRLRRPVGRPCRRRRPCRGGPALPGPRARPGRSRRPVRRGPAAASATSARTSRSDASTFSIAILITSAAEPWIGAFSAIRSAISRRWRLSLVRSGR